MQPDMNQPNFIQKRMLTASDAVSLLTHRFPVVSQTVASPDELRIAEPFYAYERFASLIQDRFRDQPFLRSVGVFIDELASSGDPLLENVLTVTILEKLAEQPTVAAALKTYIGPKAADLLERAEREVFGRK